jgi:hypothetical protein
VDLARQTAALGQGRRISGYSYRLEAYYSRSQFGWRAQPDQPSKDGYEAQFTLDFQANVAVLGHTRVRIFDDGFNFVLDLEKPAE